MFDVVVNKRASVYVQNMFYQLYNGLAYSIWLNIAKIGYHFCSTRCLEQCDQIWQNLTPMAKVYKSQQIFDGLFLIQQNAEPTLAKL